MACGTRVKRSNERRLPRQGMQDIDRPTYVQALPQPARGRGSRVKTKPHRIVPRSEKVHGIVRHFRRRRHLGQHLSVRTAEPERAVDLTIELVALLVDGAVVPATEQSEIRERGGASLGPVTDVMALTNPDAAAWEAAAAVAMVQRAS